MLIGATGREWKCASSSSRTIRRPRSGLSARRSRRRAPNGASCARIAASRCRLRPTASMRSIMLGGAQDALDDANHPYLKDEAALARAFGEADKAVLGICLGAQILARGYGAKNILGRPLEFGWHEVRADRGRPRRPGALRDRRGGADLPLAPRHLHAAARRRASRDERHDARCRPSASAAPSTASSSISRRAPSSSRAGRAISPPRSPTTRRTGSRAIRTRRRGTAPRPTPPGGRSPAPGSRDRRLPKRREDRLERGGEKPCRSRRA